MSLTKYLTVMALSNAGLWLAWVLVILNLDPREGGGIGLTLFYVSLYLAVSGTLALIGFGVRALVFRQTPLYRHLAVSHRQAFLLGLLVIVALMLQAARLFAWWNALILLAIVAGIEYLTQSRQPT
ncbi:MAG: hypothetical protein HYZ09_00115 [Candidatus Kerfeldbacteria bacterium]|nr:hypothetical protein [Candidatus Kerfeldbacteria bacterium]